MAQGQAIGAPRLSSEQGRDPETHRIFQALAQQDEALKNLEDRLHPVLIGANDPQAVPEDTTAKPIETTARQSEHHMNLENMYSRIMRNTLELSRITRLIDIE